MQKKINLLLKITRAFNTKFIIKLVVFLSCTSYLYFYLCIVTDIASNYGKLKIPMITLLFVFTILNVITAVLSYKLRTSSMKKIIHTAKNLSDSKINIDDVVIWEENEYKLLANALNIMKTNLLFFIENTKSNMLVLSNSVNQVSNSMEMTYTGNEHIATSIQEIAENSQGQLKLMLETYQKIDELSKNIFKIDNDAKEIEKIAANAKNISSSGKESLDDFNQSINIVSENINSMHQFISKLNNSISEISNINSFIIDLSKELKLLSLNAAIEAARAGEFGKGFAIVASEITKLSNAAKSSIEQINLIINNIDENGKFVEESIVKSKSDFEKGNQIFSKTKHTFNEIIDNNIVITNQIESIVGVISNINQITKNTAAICQQAYDASEIVSNSTTDVSSIVQEELAEFQEINSSIYNLKGLLNNVEKLSNRFETNAKIIDEIPAKQLSICVVTLAMGELWEALITGISYAQKDLKNRNFHIDILKLKNISPESEREIIKKIQREKYDGFMLLGFWEGFLSEFNKEQYPVVTFNNDFNSTNNRILFVGQNAYYSGTLAGEALLKNLNGNGKLLIVDSEFDSKDFAARKQGFLDTIKQNKKIKIFDEIKVPFNPMVIFELITKYLSNNPEINGIFVVAPGQSEAARAVDELGLTGIVKLIVFDSMKDIVEYIKKGTITFSVCQDLFTQGYDPLIHLYNYMTCGKQPQTDKIWTRTFVVDKENINKILN